MIFLLTIGQWSDRRAVGYVETESDAKKICAEHNSDDPSEYMEYQKVGLISGVPDVIPLACCDVCMVRKPYGWESKVLGQRYIGTNKERMITRAIDGRSYTITVCVPEFDGEFVKRMAEDLFYQFIAAVKTLFPNGYIDPTVMTEFAGYKIEWNIPQCI